MVSALPRYRSINDQRRGQFFKRARASAPYLAGTLLLGFLFIAEGSALGKSEILGYNGNGGEFLTLRSILTDEDIHYNREFQRMKYLEPIRGSASINATAYAEFGALRRVSKESSEYTSRAPHQKYY